MPRIVVLTPVFNEEDNLSRFEADVRETLLDRTDADYSVIFIDDGSADRSWEMIEDICRRDTRFKGIRLSRNFGSHIALAAGFNYAEGDAVAVLACDLQDPPGTILQFVEHWRAGNQIVWGHRRSRDETIWRSLSSSVFQAMIRRFAMPRGSSFTTGSFLLADRKVVEYYRQFREHNRITFALVAWTGFRQATVEYDRLGRQAGRSGWNFSKMIKAMYDTFVGFSPLPIQIITTAGAGTSLFSLLLGAYLLTNWLFGNPAQGWTSIMLAISSFFAVQFMLLGIMSQYLYRIYTEVVRRPLYFVSEVVNVGVEAP